jgi:hypothetical protein
MPSCIGKLFRVTLKEASGATTQTIAISGRAEPFDVSAYSGFQVTGTVLPAPASGRTVFRPRCP